ncbi:membrane dipeptidase [Pleionea sediminis]|uniref:membrane dipeptidase n=1 Tax=Pleionea sediminis TaxID=2569479 RepID=UPI001185A7B1|nr:membrane dipeptidase [Pleionea sediminis]
MKLKYIAILAFVGLLFSSNIQANQNLNAVYNLAQKCYAIQSPRNGDFLQKYHRGGALNNGLSYRFRNISSNSAARFFMKPTGLGRYMLTDVDGRFLGGHFTMRVTAGRSAGRFSEWQVNATSDRRHGHLYEFRLTGLNMKLRHNYRKGKAYFFDMWNPFNRRSESKFKLVSLSNCTPFPEITTNVEADTDLLKGHVGSPIRGYVEGHAHVTSYEFIGGKLLHGKPFDRWGVAEALKDSRAIHGPNGSLDIVGNLLEYGGLNFRYDTRGWPDFPFWPNHKQLTHTGYYYKWMERAYLSGLRLMVTHITDNKTLCRVQSTLNPKSWIGANSCNEMDSIRLQVRRLNEIQEYVDAQSGGPGKGFFRIVRSPQEAREVIADGKMAVLIGVEASETFNCGIGDNCTEQSIDAQLDELYALGVRSVFPTHKFDNQFGGSQVREGNGFINLGHYLNAGYFWQVKECDAETKGKSFTSGFPLFPDAPFISRMLGLIDDDLNPQYDENMESCNQNGLTHLGRYLVNRLIDKNMLIELDHTSNDSASSILNIIEARNYSGVVSSHSWMPSAKDGSLHSTSKRLIQAGGIIIPYNKNANRIKSSMNKILDEVEYTPYLSGIGISTDMGGLGGQAAPRSDSQRDPLNYPFVSEFGFVFDKQQSGNRTFDLNRDGVAHYGMLADHLQDVRERTSYRVYEAIMNSAEAYLQMWERAEENNSNQHYLY